MASIVSYLLYTLTVSHNCIGVSQENQTIGGLTFSKGQRVFVDLAYASLDVSPSDFQHTAPYLTMF